MAFERVAGTCWSVAASQIRAVLSQEAVTISFPLGLKAASMRTSRPLITPIGRPLAASQICAVLSPDAVTMRVPSGLNATLSTAHWMPFEGEDFAGQSRRPTLLPCCPDDR